MSPDDPITSSSRLRSWPLLFLGVLVVIFFWDSFFAGKILCMRDTFFDSMPWMKFTRQALDAGKLPLWNPYSNCGQPFLADPATAVFYPPNLLFYVLSSSLALKLWLGLHLWIAAASAYGLARHWRLEITPSLLTGIAYAFSTLVVAQMEFQGQIATSAWIPLALLAASRLIEQCRRTGHTASLRVLSISAIPATIALACVLAIQFLAGYQQIFLFSLAMLFAYGLARPLAYRESRTLLASVCGLLIAVLLMTGLVAAQLLMTWELIPLSVRCKVMDPQMYMASIHPGHLLMSILPFLFGRPGYHDQWWAKSVFEFWLGTAYIGSVPLILATFAPLALKRRSPAVDSEQQRFLLVFFGAVALLAVILAMGQFTPVYMFFWRHVPGFKLFRWPSKILLLVVFSSSVLGGIGCQALIVPRGVAAKRSYGPAAVLVTWMIGSAILGIGLGVSHRRPEFLAWLTQSPPGLNPERLTRALQDCGAAIAWLLAGLVSVALLVLKGSGLRWPRAVAVCLAFLNLFFVSRQIHFITDDKNLYDDVPSTVVYPTRQPGAYRLQSRYAIAQSWFYGSNDRSLFRWGAEASMGEAWLPLHVFKARGSGPLALFRTAVLLLRAASLPKEEARRLSNLLSIRYFMWGASTSEILWQGGPREVTRLENLGCLPRAVVVSRIYNNSDWEKVISDMLSASFDPATEAFVELGPAEFRRMQAELATPDSQNLSAAGNLESIEYGWNRIDLRIRVFRPGLLVLNESWYPGWKARVNGQLQPVLKANGIFQGVRVEPGTQVVTFIYDPWLLKLGGTICGGTGVSIGFLLAIWFFTGGSPPKTRKADGRPGSFNTCFGGR